MFSPSLHADIAAMGAQPSKSAAPAPADSVHDEKRVAVDRVSASLSSLHLRAATSQDGSISLANLDSWEHEIASKPKLQLTRTVLHNSELQAALLNRAAQSSDVHVYNTQVDFKTGPITNQKSSGRCWLFATTNVLRYNVMKKLNLDDFQLSQVSVQEMSYASRY